MIQLFINKDMPSSCRECFRNRKCPQWNRRSLWKEEYIHKRSDNCPLHEIKPQEDATNGEVVKALQPCENCCNGNQKEKAKLCQKSYLAGMNHKQELAENASWEQTGRIFMDSTNQHVYEQVCSECKGLSYFRKSSGKLISADYCPNCEAKMKGSD